MNRDELKMLRPEIPVKNLKQDNPIEQFQNNTLRQIVKFQHDFILKLVLSHPLQESVCQNKGPRSAFQLKIRKFINGQTALKNQLIGLITGLMTATEFDYYIENQRQINHRLTQMIGQRISDSLF